MFHFAEISFSLFISSLVRGSIVAGLLLNKYLISPNLVPVFEYLLFSNLEWWNLFQWHKSQASISFHQLRLFMYKKSKRFLSLFDCFPNKGQILNAGMRNGNILFKYQQSTQVMKFLWKWLAGKNKPRYLKATFCIQILAISHLSRNRYSFQILRPFWWDHLIG